MEYGKLQSSISLKRGKTVLFLFFYFEVLVILNSCGEKEKNPNWTSLLKMGLKMAYKNGVLGSPPLVLG